MNNTNSNNQEERTGLKIITFITIAYFLAIAWAVYADIIYDNNVPLDAFAFNSLYPLGLGISAVLCSWGFDKNLQSLGIRKMKWKFILIPIVLISVLMGLPFFVNGVLHLVNTGDTEAIDPELASALPIVLVLALFEEVAWRGYLYHHLSKKYSVFMVSLITGILWAVWHYPVLIHTRFIYADRPLGFAVIAFTVSVIAFSFIYTYLRKKSGSIWSAVIFHGFANYIAFAFLDALEKTESMGDSVYFKSDIGITYLIVYAIAAYICYDKTKLYGYKYL